MSRDILITPVVEFAENPFKKFIRLLFDQISQINQGKTANTGTVTLTASQATTVLDHPGFDSGMGVFFSPLTANAAAEMDGMYISARTKDQFTITHANNAEADRNFVYIVVG